MNIYVNKKKLYQKFLNVPYCYCKDTKNTYKTNF